MPPKSLLARMGAVVDAPVSRINTNIQFYATIKVTAG
jgi:hypothetical protein